VDAELISGVAVTRLAFELRQTLGRRIDRVCRLCEFPVDEIAEVSTMAG
jgi:hypothetical protein